MENLRLRLAETRLREAQSLTYPDTKHTRGAVVAQRLPHHVCSGSAGSGLKNNTQNRSAADITL